MNDFEISLAHILIGSWALLMARPELTRLKQRLRSKLIDRRNRRG